MSEPVMSGMPSSPMLAAVGTFVEVELHCLNGDCERLSLNIGANASADFAAGFLGAGTPLGRALIGQPPGCIVPYQAGDVVEARLLNVAPAQQAAPGDVEARRQATIRKAVSQSDLTNAVTFAASFSGKWGDYDPSGLEEGWEKAD